MKPIDLMAKAQKAANSAIILLEAGDVDGACGRAYYAMFNAARAALIAANASVAEDMARSHSGLIAAFSLHLVKTGKFPVELGRSLNKVEDLRLIADYKGEAVELDIATWAVEQAQAFVKAVETGLFPKTGGN